MYDDPRTRARSFLESSSIISELEDVLNHLVYEKPDDLHGYLVSSKLIKIKILIHYFLDRLKSP